MSGYLQRLLAQGTATGGVSTGGVRPQSTLPYHVDAIAPVVEDTPFASVSDRDGTPPARSSPRGDDLAVRPGALPGPDEGEPGDGPMAQASASRPLSADRSPRSRRARAERVADPHAESSPVPGDAPESGAVDARPRRPVAHDLPATEVGRRHNLDGTAPEPMERSVVPPIIAPSTTPITTSLRTPGESRDRDFRLLPDIRNVSLDGGAVRPAVSREVAPRIESGLLPARRDDRVRASGADAAPTEVHVTIGRIEVTAVHAPAPSTRPPRSSRQPMSLDEYLSRRKGSGT